MKLTIILFSMIFFAFGCSSHMSSPNSGGLKNAAPQAQSTPIDKDSPTGVLKAFTLPVWSLYGSATYFLLGKLKRFRKQPVSGIDTPPAPPSFESEK